MLRLASSITLAAYLLSTPLAAADAPWNCAQSYQSLYSRRLVPAVTTAVAAAHGAGLYALANSTSSKAPVSSEATDRTIPKHAFENVPSPSRALAKPKQYEDSPRLKTKEELIAEAQAMLQEWSKTRKWNPALPDFGELLVHAELNEQKDLQPQLGRVLREYGRIKAEAKTKIGSSLFRRTQLDPDSIQPVAAWLTDGPLQGYCDEKASLSAYITHACGNCDAYTRMLIAVLSQKGLELGDRYRLGFQNLKDHLEPVIWDSKTNAVKTPTGSVWSKTSYAPVYDPAGIVMAFLAGQKVAVSPEMIQKALIRKADPPPKQNPTVQPKTDSTLDFSIFESSYWKSPNALPPKFSVRSSRNLEVNGSAGSIPEAAPERKPGQDNLTIRNGKLEINGSPLSVVVRPGQSLPFAPTWAGTSSPQIIEISFRTQEIKDAVLSAKDDEELERLLLSIARRDNAELLSSKGFILLQRMLNDPSLLSKMNADDIRQVDEAWNALSARAFPQTGENRNIRNWSILYNGMNDALIEQSKWKQSIEPVFKSLKSYEKTTNDNSMQILRNLARMPAEEQTRFMTANRWEKINDYSGPMFFNAFFDIASHRHPLEQMQSDLLFGKIAISDKKREAPAPAMKVHFIPILSSPQGRPDFQVHPPQKKMEGIQNGVENADSKAKSATSQARPAPAPPPAPVPQVAISRSLAAQLVLATQNIDQNRLPHLQVEWFKNDLTAGLRSLPESERAQWDTPFQKWISTLLPMPLQQLLVLYKFPSVQLYRVHDPQGQQTPTSLFPMPRNLAEHFLEVQKRREPGKNWVIEAMPREIIEAALQATSNNSPASAQSPGPSTGGGQPTGGGPGPGVGK